MTDKPKPDKPRPDKPKPIDWAAVRATLERNTESFGRMSSAAADAIMKRRAERFMTATPGHVETEEMIVFRRRDTVYAIAVAALSEIQRLPRVTTLPGISKVVLGVFNARGRVAVLHDLAGLSGQAPPDNDAVNRADDGHGHDLAGDADAWALMIADDIHQVAIMADDVDGVRQFARSDIREVPSSMRARAHCFLGVGPNGTVFVDAHGLITNRDFFYA